MILEKIDGFVTRVFAHRFVVEGPQGKTLIDIGPDAALTITEGDRIVAEGERTPSKRKVTSITLADGSIHEIRLGNKPKDATALVASP